MLSVQNLKVEFGVVPLFEDVSFIVNDREKVCLVGRNGAGKSTLLKIIAGKMVPTSGTVSFSNNTSIGYLPQIMSVSDTQTLFEEAETAFGHLKELQNKYEQVNEQLNASSDYESEEYLKLVDEASYLHEKLQISGINDFKAEIERTLFGLGFNRDDFSKPTSVFSGGWRMRIELAKILLQKPDLLLLDEPTNHLDIESIQWFENFLRKESKSSVILVSHDRAFINNVASRTLEISCSKIIDYKVKYDDFVRLRAERRQQQLRAYENQQKEIASINAFVERFRYQATKAVQVQSRLKQLEKIVPVKIDDIDRSQLHLKFNEPSRSGDFPLICKSVSKNYGSHLVFRDINLTLKRGEKIAFVGRNGEGKSTLVKCIMGQVDFMGDLKIGHNVEIGYYAQDQAQKLDENLSVFDTIDQVTTGEMRLKIRDILGSFMFGGEAYDKKVGVLSGGERSRLAMIKLLLEPVNFLILDEPTNHLDIQSKNVLKEAIKNFKGSAIIVSHDRDFLKGLVTKVYEFKNQGLREHIGGIDDFLSKHLEVKTDLMSTSKHDEDKKVNDNSSLYEQQKEARRKQNKIQKQIAEIENEIGDLEKKISELEKSMSTSNETLDMGLFDEHKKLNDSLQSKMNCWEELMQQLEEITH